MSTSDFTQTQQQIMDYAFTLLGVKGNYKEIQTSDYNFASTTLNMMLKAWSAQGLHLWEKDEAVLFVTPNQNKYIISEDTTSAYCCRQKDLIQVQLIANANAGATTITVNSATGLTLTANIGILYPDNTIQWTTISNIVGQVITLAAPLTKAATQNTYIYSFVNRIFKPLRIIDKSCRRVFSQIRTDYTDIIQKQEIWLKELAYSDYMALSNKTNQGLTSTFMYLPKVTTGEFYLWLTPVDASQQIYFSYERIIQDLDAFSDNFDLPSEWLEAISWQLALRLAPAYGKEDRGISYITPIASQMLDNLKQWDNENVEIKIKLGKYS